MRFQKTSSVRLSSYRSPVLLCLYSCLSIPVLHNKHVEAQITLFSRAAAFQLLWTWSFSLLICKIHSAAPAIGSLAHPAIWQYISLLFSIYPLRPLNIRSKGRDFVLAVLLCVQHLQRRSPWLIRVKSSAHARRSVQRGPLWLQHFITRL